MKNKQILYFFMNITGNDAFEIAKEFTFPSRTIDDIEDYEDVYYMVDHYYENKIEFAVLSKPNK